MSTIKNNGSANDSGNIATGSFVFIFNSCPLASIEVYLKNDSALLFLANTLSIDFFTASAVNGCPFEKVTPSLILKVHSNLSLLNFQFSASNGFKLPFSSKIVKFSPTP